MFFAYLFCRLWCKLVQNMNYPDHNVHTVHPILVEQKIGPFCSNVLTLACSISYNLPHRNKNKTRTHSNSTKDWNISIYQTTRQGFQLLFPPLSLSFILFYVKRWIVSKFPFRQGNYISSSWRWKSVAKLACKV